MIMMVVFLRNLIKMAKVVPIYKSGATMEVNNYTPISVLRIFSKVLERVMYDRLIPFLLKFIYILYQPQFEFRQGQSTHHVDYKITKSLDNGYIVIGVFLDFNKVFDPVDQFFLKIDVPIVIRSKVYSKVI